jgi:hypothetical protein
MDAFQSLADLLGVPDPANPDRPVADPPPEKQTVQEFCKNVLRSREYRESLMRRILTDDLPPQIEMMLWDRAHGKMKDQLSLSGDVAVTKVVREIVDAAVDRGEPSEPPKQSVH